MKHISYLVICILLACVGWVTSAQSTEVLIVAGNSNGERNTPTLNPLLCDNDACRHLTHLLFPSLLNFDKQTGNILLAEHGQGVVDNWSYDANGVVTYTLSDDLQWSDGTPITAYDIFYSYEIIRRTLDLGDALERMVAGIVPINDTTLQVAFLGLTCSRLHTFDFPIIPYHIYEADLTDKINYGGGNIEEWYENFDHPSLHRFRENPEIDNPTVTAGLYRLAERRFNEAILLYSDDGTVAYRYDDLSASQSAVDQFLRGDSNLVVNPPYNRWHDLQVDDSAQVITVTGDRMYFIALNMADPENPQSAFDEEGNPIEQGNHPILHNPAVREAIQLAIDVDALIDATTEGNATRLASVLSPSSWVETVQLTLTDHDPRAAERLLFEAGWRDIDRDGIRECLSCEFAEQDSTLTLSLLYREQSTATPSIRNSSFVTLLRKQLFEVGIELQLNPASSNIQEFDMILMDNISEQDGTSVIWDMFRQIQDDAEIGSNFTSYSNPELEDLLDTADEMQNCDKAIRLDLYQQAQELLANDTHFIWLFSPQRMIATRPRGDIVQVNWEDFLP